MSFSVNNTFGSSLIIGDYGEGKTFGSEIISYEAKDKYPEDVCLISNIPNKIVDIPYNSPEDLRQIIEWLFRFFQESNKDLQVYNSTYRDILLMIDEAHLYFPQDGTVLSGDKELMSKLRIILTQCRKRNLKIYLCTQRGKTININIRRYTDYIYLFVMQKFFDNSKFRKNTLEIYKCGGGVADLLGEDGVSWATFEDLQKDRIDTLTMKYNTFLFEKFYKLEHIDWNLWNEKHLTQYICGLPGDYLNISTYDDFLEKLIYGKIKDDRKYNKIYNHDGIKLLDLGMINFYMSKDERENAKFKL